MNTGTPSGFTLIEILMVVALVAIISAVAIPQFIDFSSDAKSAVTRDRLNGLRSAIAGDGSSRRTGYISHMGGPPASLNDLVSKGTKPDFDPIAKLGWNGPYVEASSDWNLDAWGNPLELNVSSRSIRSCGPNSVCGDADDIVVTF